MRTLVATYNEGAGLPVLTLVEDSDRPGVTLDSARNGNRALTFSRYAGIGSHRYPVGFSGDTVVSWDSLRFQPEFTAAAANTDSPEAAKTEGHVEKAKK